ncbi:hypothetical protein [Nocardia panacis]|uniref:hypothetical protein n=1 Tax=Nocardia panacis TaxID=2340916 RepID=UPI001EEF855F|nr:hypothetical protein [Nocardia panacis]
MALAIEGVGEPGEGVRSRGRDAVWLGHAWVDGRKGDGDIAGLVGVLRGTGIRDLFVHTGPLADDGGLDPGLAPKARWFVEAAHRELPGVRVQAWLGNLVAPEYDGLRLVDRGTRDRVTASAGAVLGIGFDGVHFDMEPVRSGEGGFLELLDQVRAVTQARGAVLSVSAPQIDPLPGLHAVGIAVADHGKWWAQGYFAQVARRVDQVAVMSYDTSMPWKALFGGYVTQQTTLALEVTPAEVDLLMGLPAFRADNIAHHGAAETVPAAVRGVRLGLGRHDPNRANFGVALYVDFAATPEDWATYRRDWCQ